MLSLIVVEKITKALRTPLGPINKEIILSVDSDVVKV